MWLTIGLLGLVWCGVIVYAGATYLEHPDDRSVRDYRRRRDAYREGRD